MRATSWADLNLPHDAKGLRSAQRAVHPDVCLEADAHDAFTKLTVLFEAPDMDLRLAKGSFKGGKVEWKFDTHDQDLADLAHKAHNKIRKVKDGELWVAESSLLGTTLTNTYGDGWWFLRSFPKLDERTVVWVVKRLMAVITLAEKAGMVHGDINKNTVALNPSLHGLRLDGWWTSVNIGESLQVKPDAETLTKYLRGAEVDAKLSVSQAAKMLLDNNCGVLEPLLEKFWTNPPTPQEAFQKLDDASRAKFGKPTWHELKEPKSKGI